MGVKEKYIAAIEKYMQMDNLPGREIRATSVWHDIQPTGLRGKDRWELTLGIGIQNDPERSIVIHTARDGCRMVILQNAHATKALLRQLPTAHLTN